MECVLSANELVRLMRKFNARYTIGSDKSTFRCTSTRRIKMMIVLGNLFFFFRCFWSDEELIFFFTRSAGRSNKKIELNAVVGAVRSENRSILLLQHLVAEDRLAQATKL